MPLSNGVKWPAVINLAVALVGILVEVGRAYVRHRALAEAARHGRD